MYIGITRRGKLLPYRHRLCKLDCFTKKPKLFHAVLRKLKTPLQEHPLQEHPLQGQMTIHRHQCTKPSILARTRSAKFSLNQGDAERSLMNPQEMPVDDDGWLAPQS